MRCREGTRRPLRLSYSSRKLRHTSVGVKLASMSMPTLVYRYTDTPVQRHTGTLAHWYTGTLFHRCTNAQVHKYTGTLVHRDTDTLIHWYTSTLVNYFGVCSARSRKLFWDRLGALSGVILGLSSSRLVALWGPLGISWGLFGLSWGHVAAVFEPSGAIWG